MIETGFSGRDFITLPVSNYLRETMKLFLVDGPSGGEHYAHSSYCLLGAEDECSAIMTAAEHMGARSKKCTLLANECLESGYKDGVILCVSYRI